LNFVVNSQYRNGFTIELAMNYSNYKIKFYYSTLTMGLKYDFSDVYEVM